ncbi:lipopolysaccharide biosynthesis protein [Aquimarina agarivorans]|uniref:lipopolysaccharide biosynthesis protein n=1 Tax=Aquimarina agarivorans TaxID=980584 RepID=UPI000248E700|nr:oligosaccharide flippase family protein [Aquimarina agarivorans]
MSQLKKGAILSYVTIFLTNIVGLLLTPFIIKSLGQSEYGLYILLGSFVGYISLLDFGLSNTIVRFVAKYRANNDHDGEKNFLATVFIIYTIMSFVVLLIGAIAYFNIELIFGSSLTSTELEKAKILMLLLVLNMTITLPGQAFTGICSGYEKFVFPRIINIVRYIVRSLLVVTILLYGGKSIAIVAIDTFLNIAIILANMFYVLKVMKVKIKLMAFDKELIRTIFSYSVWIFVFAMIGQLFWKSGQMILGVTISTEAVAIFAIGIVLSGYFGAFAGAINSVFLPKATFMVEANSTRKDLTAMFVKVGRILTFLLLFIWAEFILFGRDFIELWVGAAYKDSYMITAVIMTAYILPLVQNFANSLIEASGKFKFKAKVYFITISLGIIIGALLSPYYGYWAITWSYSIFWVISQIIMNWFFDKELNLDMKFFFKETFGKLSIVLIISLVSGYFINQLFEANWGYFLIKASLYAVIYLSLTYFFVLNEYEKNLFLKFRR